MKFVFTDGGRRKDGYTTEFNDCTVRALAIATDAEYTAAYNLLKRWGRHFRSGFQLTRFLDARMPLGHSATRMKLGKRLSIQEFVRQHPTGTFIVTQVRGNYIIGFGSHVFCIRDGIRFDTFNDGNTIVSAYQINRLNNVC